MNVFFDMSLKNERPEVNERFFRLAMLKEHDWTVV